MSKPRKRLIVSCQAEEGSLFNAREFIAAFVMAAEFSQGISVRICDPQNVAAVKRDTKLPIIALTKGYYPSGKVLIARTIDDTHVLVDAGADIIAVDTTKRERPEGAPKLYVIDQNYQSPFEPIEYAFPSKTRTASPPNVSPQPSGTGRIAK